MTMGTLIAGSTNLVTYKTYVSDVLTQAATIAVVAADGNGTTVELAGTPTWTAAGYTLEITETEVDAAHVGECWTLTWTWTYGGDTFRDVIDAYVVETQDDRLLATKADLALYGYDPDAYTMLMRASLRVRRYARQTISRVTGDVVSDLTAPYLLPQRPVLSVTSVVDEEGTTLEAGTDGDYVVRGAYLDMDAGTGPVTVTYTHGYATIPDEVVEVVCAVASRMYGEPDGLKMGAQAEGASGEGITWGVNAYAGVADLTPEEKRVIDRFYPRTGRAVDVL